ncbi:uncharacterized protein LY89DRAFT_742543 [Mollisia scopiformis]|uniref:Nephrocystin 3-like N-terminal domain-containing protein n=1 Tax=Mollisia scopiformis TaxID=149040 RepID=A0A132B605_MOLSC|nr:uncharacterized protein LY89DRAFT_742543 [Mollisia scopiformis]KUJ07771.1 hypothetical protein LY89DRAFT_742543 [Mollisia scopiformis]
MDGLSVAASVAGIVQLADTIFTRLQRYAKAVKHASKDIRNLSDQIRELSMLLHHLKLIVNGLEEEEEEEREEAGLSRDESSSNLADFRLHHVSSCYTTLRGIEDKLDKYLPKGQEHRRFKQALRDLKWPFSASDIKELLAEVEAHKRNIHLALSGETLAVVFKTLSRQDDLAAGIEEIKANQNERWAMQVRIHLDKKKEDVLAFFCKVDPSSNHRMSLKLRHPMTGLWVTEGLKFQAWLVTRNSKLWLSGIPGAGKTVIAACVIEEAMKRSSQDHAVAYFYCDYKDEEKQKPVEILGSLANQLAKLNEEAYSKLEQLYHGCHTNKSSGACAPKPEELLSTINEMASCFDEVSVLVDGLDECGRTHTPQIVQLLAGLASGRSSNTRTLFLSRDEPEISAILKEEYTHLRIEAHSEDLRLYVTAEIETRQHKTGREQLRIRSAGLKDEITKTLIERAGGMFRWVSCQLDYLCSLRTDALKNKALKSLPPGLEETYERILQQVNQEDITIQRMVQRTLQWTVSSLARISKTALSHAISIEDNDRIIDLDSVYEEEDILMYCSSLIRRSADGEYFEMAHFTVKEYLSKLPIEGADCSDYSQAQQFVFPQLAITCLNYLLLDSFNGSIIEDLETWKDQSNKYPFREHAVEYWTKYAQEHMQNDRVSELSQHLFGASRGGCFLSWARDYFYHDVLTLTVEGSMAVLFDKFTRDFCAGGLKPLHMAAALGLPSICSWLLESNCGVTERCYLGAPLHCTILGRIWLVRSQVFDNWFNYRAVFDHDDAEDTEGRNQVLEMLLAKGADCKALYQDGFGVEFSCSYLAFFFQSTANANYPLLKLLAEGSELDEKVMAYIERHSDRILDERDFVEALICKLKEMDLAQAFRLQAALKLDTSGSRAIAKYISKSSVPTSTSGQIDLFLSAIRFDQTERMEELIRNERLDIILQDPNSIAEFLHAAAKRKAIGALRLLLSLGADINSVDQDGWTALHFVALDMDKNERHEQ